MPITPKNWQDAPSTATPLSADALEDMETRLGAYADARVAPFETSVVYAKGYGVTADGTTDDRANLQTAVDAAVALITASGKGATLILPYGVIALTSSHPSPPSTHPGAKLGIRLPVSLAAKLTIRGQGSGVTTIRLSTNAKCAFWIAEFTAFDTFKNVTLEDFDVDNNSVIGRCQTIIGNVPEYVTPQRDLNVEDITCRRMRTYNVPTDATEATTYKAAIWFQGAQTLESGPTQTHTTNVVLEDIVMEDTQNGLLVHSNVGHTPNHYYDNIKFRRCSHKIAALPAAALFQTSFYVCGSGIGNYCEIADCYSENVGDNGIEVGALQRMVVKNFRCKNPFLVGILLRNTQAPPDVLTQRLTVEDYKLDVDATLGAISGATGKSIGVLCDNSLTAGAIELIRPVLKYDGLKRSFHGLTDLALGVGSAPVRRVELISPRIRVSNYIHDSGTSSDTAIIGVRPAASGLTVIIRDLDIKATASITSGSLFLYGVYVEGSQARCRVDGYDLDVNGTVLSGGGGGTVYGFGIVKNSGSNCSAVVRRFVPQAFTGLAGSAFGVLVGGGGTLKQLLIEACDFTLWSPSGDVRLDTATAANLAVTQQRHNAYSSAIASSAITVTASPFAYRNTTTFPALVTVTGGTVSKVEIGDTAQVYRDTLLTSGTFQLAPGQYLRVTYTVAPTMLLYPQP